MGTHMYTTQLWVYDVRTCYSVSTITPYEKSVCHLTFSSFSNSSSIILYLIPFICQRKQTLCKYKKLLVLP